MQIGMAPFSLGFALAVIALVFAVLMMAGVLPMTPLWAGGLLALLATARLT